MKNNLDLYISSIYWVHQGFSNQVYLKYTLNLFLKCNCISFLNQKYNWSRRSKLANWHSNIEVYLKYNFYIDAIIFKLISIPETDFLNLCIYVQIQKYTLSRLSKLMYLLSNSEVYNWSRLSKLMYLCSITEVYLK